MSRIGKLPILVPPEIKVDIRGQEIEVSRKDGLSMRRVLRQEVKVELVDGHIVISPVVKSRLSRSVWGLSRSLVSNMVTGVSKGFEKILEISGTGYRAEAKGGMLLMSLGFSHPVEFNLPEGVKAQVEKQTKVTLHSHDLELLGQVAAKIREIRPPEPYKGKGIKYSTETIRRKAGKAGRS